MKRLISVCVVMILLSSSVFVFSGCSKKNISESNYISVEETNENDSVLKNKDLYYFVINGQKYDTDSKLKDVEASGYKLDKIVSEQNVLAKKYVIGGEYFKNSEGRTAFYVTPINNTNDTIKENEAQIGAFSIDKYYYENSNKDISIYNGITIGSSEEEIISNFGEPTEKDMREKYDNLGILYIYRAGPSKYFEFEIEKNDRKVSKITWRYFDL